MAALSAFSAVGGSGSAPARAAHRPDLLQGGTVDACLGERPPDEVTEVLAALVRDRFQLVVSHEDLHAQGASADVTGA
jgi:hypothetical protein